MTHKELIHKLLIIADYVEAQDGKDKEYIIETLACIGDELAKVIK